MITLVEWLNFGNNMYSLITIYANWKEGKIHISKEIDTMDTMCGKNMGFDYGILSQNGFEDSSPKHLSLDEINKIKNLCQVCKKTLNSKNK